jgi:serine/threonine-protein kinase
MPPQAMPPPAVPPQGPPSGRPPQGMPPPGPPPAMAPQGPPPGATAPAAPVTVPPRPSTPLFVPPRAGDFVQNQRGFRYKLLSALNSGGFSSVYDGVDIFETPVAIKVFSPTAPYAEVKDRWFAEAALLQQLVHPNITYIYDAFEYRNGFYLVLEKAKGNLGAYITGVPTLHPNAVLFIAQQLFMALHFIHERQVVHEDLHPGNILEFAGRVVKVSDFGISRRLAGPDAKVAPETFHRKFVVPELASQGFTNRQSDLYHVGLILYALVTGHHAIDPTLPDEEVSRLVIAGVPRVRAEELQTPLGNAIAKLLRRRHEYRYHSALDAWNSFRPLLATRNFDAPSAPGA